MKIRKENQWHANICTVLITDLTTPIDNQILTPEEVAYIKKQHAENNLTSFTFDRLKSIIWVSIHQSDKKRNRDNEILRKAGAKMATLINENRISEIQLIAFTNKEISSVAFAEGMALANYKFIQYKTDREKFLNSLMEIILVGNNIDTADIERLNIIAERIWAVRDWVNAPLNYFNATTLAQTIKKVATAHGVAVETLSRNKIQALKMGGILAVNQGSIDPPTFTIMEWNPDHTVNSKPIILVGKGVVYDTGGMNLKTGNFMNDMKCDMAGAATTANVVIAAAQAKLPIHVMALIPATDNRVHGNAYVSGDVITMYDNTTVEVLNTDAEGRMILADALSYAKKYDPELVIDMATLTGAAARAIGTHGIVAMGNTQEEMDLLKICGDEVYERIAEFPFWEEYAQEIKSDIADIKNIGGAEGGAIHAGKFLEHFTDYPYIHLDIAGVAYVNKSMSYHGKGATGIGFRILFDFLCRKSVKQ